MSEAFGDRWHQLHVEWEDGSSLMLIPEDGDRIRRVTEGADR